MKTLIIQTSPYRTASTFLVNALYGLIPELNNTKIVGHWDDNFEQYFRNIIVLKHHNINIDKLMLQYADKYNLFFVCSERKEQGIVIDHKFKFYKNVCVFDFNELNETSNNTVSDIIQHIFKKLSVMLPFELNIEGGLQRVNAMNIRYKEIHNSEFEYIDDFFEIHGSHRNRKCKVKPQTEFCDNFENFIREVTLQNKQIHCIHSDAIISQSLLKGNYWELWMLNYFKRFYREKSNMVDVGG